MVEREFCDRCRTEIKKSFLEIFFPMGIVMHEYGINGKGYVFCKECVKEFKKFLKEE